MENGAAIAAVALHGGLLALIGIWLAMIVGGWRRKTGISIGDGGNIDLIRAMRGQANYIEAVPISIALMLAVAIAGGAAWTIHIAGVVLIVGRILHGIHFSAPGKPGWMRGAGSGLSLLAMLALALLAIWRSFALAWN
jgi:uncharacterized membrane protein YecN with MAPEG domain